MLISNEDASRRLASSSNLLNRLRADSSRSASKPSHTRAMNLFGVGRRTDDVKQESEIVVDKSQLLQDLLPAEETPTKPKDSYPEESHPIFSNPNLSLATLSEPKPEVKEPEVLPAIDDLVDDADHKIKVNNIQKDAIETLAATIKEIKIRIPEVSKVEKLADVAAKMSKIVSDLNEKKDDDKEKTVHLHFYTPERKKVTDYETVEV